MNSHAELIIVWFLIIWLSAIVAQHCQSCVSMIILTKSQFEICNMESTVKHVLSGHSKTDKTQILMSNGTLLKVESIAECSPWSILQYF